MNHATRRSVVAVLMMCAALSLNAGCTSKLERAYSTRAIFNVGLSDLIAMRKAGAVDDHTYTSAVKLADALSPTLDELDRSALEDNAFSFQAAYDKTRDRLNDFLVWVAKARTQKPAAAAVK